MATAVSFPEQNIVFEGPPDDKTISDLPARTGWVDFENGEGPVPVIVSCWELTPAELERVKETGRVYCWVFAQITPPVAISGDPPEIPAMPTGDGAMGFPPRI